MVQGSNGNWLRRTQPLRRTRRETRWGLHEDPVDSTVPARLPIVGGARADVTLLKVGACRRRPPLRARDKGILGDKIGPLRNPGWALHGALVTNLSGSKNRKLLGNQQCHDWGHPTANN